MFVLTDKEVKELSRSKILTLNNESGRGHNIKYNPHAFTESGLYMLMTVLRGELATDEKLTFLDMKLFEDNIYNLLNIAEEYILKNIRWRSEITGMEREEIPEIPVAVIREVLANGFAHAIYNGRTTHEICIHPGMITVYSPGEYANKHKPEEYIKDNIESEIRNATIAKILYLSKSIEQFGSGFKRINSRWRFL